MKKLALSALSAMMVLGSLPAGAATATGNFNVNVSLTSACQLSTPPGNIDIAYTSFATAAVEATADFAVLCTNGLSYTLSLNTANADTMGLTIPLDIRNAGNTAAVTGPQTQSGATATGYKIRASISAGQQGNCATSPTACTSTIGRILTVTY